MKNIWLSSLKALLLLTIITGVIYPLFITVIAKTMFYEKADGSIVYKDGKAVGSALIGQKFTSDKYFWSRPSAIDYNPLPSGGSNLGPTSKALLDTVNTRRKIFINRNNMNANAIVPNDALFASGSGVDPDITPASAYLEVTRIAKARNFNDNQKAALADLIKNQTECPQFGFLGEEKINVLSLNIELDKIK
jgi:potassium-transporting ATPase KdpC subunit